MLVVWPDLAAWRSDHAAGALDDLADGCALSLGPMFDGGFYLVAFARPVRALLELADDAWRRPDPIGLAADARPAASLAIGLLRTERGLRTPADVRALLADPLLDDELRAASQLAFQTVQCTGEWCNGSPPAFGAVRSRFKSGLPSLARSPQAGVRSGLAPRIGPLSPTIDAWPRRSSSSSPPGRARACARRRRSCCIRCAGGR